MEGPISYQTAIQAMRRDTSNGKTFELKFLSCSLSTKTSEGVKLISKAFLRAEPPIHKDRYVKHKLYLFDTVSRENRQCWQILLLEYNGIKVSVR